MRVIFSIIFLLAMDGVISALSGIKSDLDQLVSVTALATHHPANFYPPNP